jgi:predicted  nucleic acid-binding Zn-ribbon protein
MKNNDQTVNELLALQKRIEEAKSEKSRIEGELTSLLKRLKEEFGSDDVAQVEKKVEAMKQQAARLRKQIEDGLVVLRKEMGE